METAALIIAIYFIMVTGLTIKCMLKAQHLPDDIDVE
jgi:hypothetical protein